MLHGPTMGAYPDRHIQVPTMQIKQFKTNEHHSIWQKDAYMTEMYSMWKFEKKKTKRSGDLFVPHSESFPQELRKKTHIFHSFPKRQLSITFLRKPLITTMTFCFLPNPNNYIISYWRVSRLETLKTFAYLARITWPSCHHHVISRKTTGTDL